MDVIEKLSSRFTSEILPLVKWELELAYVVTMVMLAVKTADRTWHKSNVFYSYLRALFYVKGAEIVLAICSGTSPIGVMSCNTALLTVALVWWLLLFMPFDVFSKILHIQTGDIKPIILLISLMTSLRQLVVVDEAVSKSLADYPGSYIAIFTGTLAGNGCLVVATMFGDFSKAISSHKTTNTAFVVAALITLTKILCPKVVAESVLVTFLAVSLLLLEFMEALGQKVEVFDSVYELIRRVVVTCDLIDPN